MTLVRVWGVNIGMEWRERCALPFCVVSFCVYMCVCVASLLAGFDGTELENVALNLFYDWLFMRRPSPRFGMRATRPRVMRTQKREERAALCLLCVCDKNGREKKKSSTERREIVIYARISRCTRNGNQFGDKLLILLSHFMMANFIRW